MAIDTETTGLNVKDGRDHLIGISLAWDNEALYLPFRHIDTNYTDLVWPILIRKIISKHKTIFHNVKIDMASLETFGIDNVVGSTWFDTMLLGHLLSEEVPFAKSLDAMAKHFLKNEGKHKTDEFNKYIKLAGWGMVPSSMMAEYATYDAKLTYDLYKYFVSKLVEEKLADYWSNKRLFVNLVYGMEKRGILIDQELCRRKVSEGQHEMAKIIHKLDGRNPASPKDLKTLLIDKLGLPVIISPKTGRPTFDKTAMQEYEIILSRSDNDTARSILAFRGWQKSVSSNYSAYLELLSPDGKLRPSYKHHGTVTGRMSCEKPNLQQIPRNTDHPWNGEMKTCFIPTPGYTLIEVDYSQLELRLGSAYGEEESLLQVFREGRDIFTEMAAQLGFTRQETKTLVYSMQYGAGLNRLMNVFGVSQKRAAEIKLNYETTYPGFKKASVTAAAIARSRGKIQLWSGRYRHFTYPQQHAHKAFNSIIQGGAADVVEQSMLRLQQEGFNTEDCRMLLQVHDSVVFEMRTELVDNYVPRIKAIMEAVPEPFNEVTFNAEAKVWGAKE